MVVAFCVEKIFIISINKKRQVYWGIMLLLCHHVTRRRCKVEKEETSGCKRLTLCVTGGYFQAVATSLRPCAEAGV